MCRLNKDALPPKPVALVTSCRSIWDAQLNRRISAFLALTSGSIASVIALLATEVIADYVT